MNWARSPIAASGCDEWATEFNYYLPSVLTFVVPYIKGDISDRTYPRDRHLLGRLWLCRPRHASRGRSGGGGVRQASGDEAGQAAASRQPHRSAHIRDRVLDCRGPDRVPPGPRHATPLYPLAFRIPARLQQVSRRDALPVRCRTRARAPWRDSASPGSSRPSRDGCRPASAHVPPRSWAWCWCV